MCSKMSILVSNTLPSASSATVPSVKSNKFRNATRSPMISAPLSAFVFSSSFFGSLDPSARTTSTHTPSSCAAAFFTASSRSPKPLRTTSSRCAIVSARGCVNPTRASSTEPVQCFSRTAV